MNHDFRDNGHTTPGGSAYYEFLYDKNGNMTSDLNKGITSVEYNYLDLAEKINLGSEGIISYTYTAAGTKLQSVYNTGIAGAKDQKTDYCGAFVYEGDKLSYILTSYGRISYGYVYYPDDIAHEELVNADKSIFVRRHREYFLTDHLGNVRVVFARGTDGKAKTVQETHYYAHGLQICGLGIDNSKNEYFYNGKELQEEAGLNYLNYGWRQLDPQLGLWHSVDKLAEWYPNMSPYAYANNNPINYIDINGLTSGSPTTKNPGFSSAVWDMILGAMNGNDYHASCDAGGGGGGFGSRGYSSFGGGGTSSSGGYGHGGGGGGGHNNNTTPDWYFFYATQSAEYRDTQEQYLYDEEGNIIAENIAKTEDDFWSWMSDNSTHAVFTGDMAKANVTFTFGTFGSEFKMFGFGSGVYGGYRTELATIDYNCTSTETYLDANIDPEPSGVINAGGSVGPLGIDIITQNKQFEGTLTVGGVSTSSLEKGSEYYTVLSGSNAFLFGIDYSIQLKMFYHAGICLPITNVSTLPQMQIDATYVFTSRYIF